MIARIACVLIALVCFFGCKTPAMLTPPTGPGTPYPCGYSGVSCYPIDQTHTCCLENYSCVTGGCSYDGNDHTFGASAAGSVTPRAAER
jgi:hypothetical protein